VQLCFFAHKPEQLRVTAKSLAAAQAQANSGKGKGKNSKAKNGAEMHGSSELQTAGASSKLADAVRAAQHSTDAGGGGAGQSPAAVEFLHKVCADEAMLALLLQTLGAADGSSTDGATASVVKALLEPQQDSLEKLARSCASYSSLLGGGSGSQGSDASSPRTPVQQTISLPAEAAAALRKDTVLTPVHGAGAVSSSACTGKSSSYSCSVQEHIQNVMEGKVTADQVRRDTARLLDSRARAFTSSRSVGAPCAPLELLQPAPAYSPAAGRSAYSLATMQRAPLDLMSPGMPSCLAQGPLGSPEIIPMVNMGRANSAFLGPAQLQVAGLSRDLGALSSCAISSYGAGCILQTASSLDTLSSSAAGGFNGRLSAMDSNSCNASTTAGFSSFMSLDSSAAAMLSPELLRKLSLQQGMAAGGAASLNSPLIAAPNMMHGLQSPGQAAAAAAASQQQLLEAEMAQQHAVMLLQQQQAIAAAGASRSPVQVVWGGDGRGVTSMLGTVSGVGVFSANSPAMAAWC
jgi:hypothetical protein